MEARTAGVKPKTTVDDALRGLIVSPACKAIGAPKTKWKWMKAVLCSDLPPAARVVGIYLCDRIDESGITFPSRETIASELHLNLREVDRALKTLRDRRFLASVRARWSSARNIYALCDPKVAGMVDDAFKIIKSAKGAKAETRSKRAETTGDVGFEHDVSVGFEDDTHVGFHKDDSKETIQRERSPSSFPESNHKKRPFVGDQRENVVPFPPRPAPSAPAATAAAPAGLPTGSWPFDPRDTENQLLDRPIPPGNESQFREKLCRDLVRFGSPEIRAASGFNKEHDSPDHRWLPASVWPVISASYKAGTLTSRSLLDALAPALASGELRKAFDRARIKRWMRLGRDSDSDLRRDDRFGEWVREGRPVPDPE